MPVKIDPSIYESTTINGVKSVGYGQNGLSAVFQLSAGAGMFPPGTDSFNAAVNAVVRETGQPVVMNNVTLATPASVQAFDSSQGNVSALVPRTTPITTPITTPTTSSLGTTLSNVSPLLLIGGVVALFILLK